MRKREKQGVQRSVRQRIFSAVLAATMAAASMPIGAEDLGDAVFLEENAEVDLSSYEEGLAEEVFEEASEGFFVGEEAEDDLLVSDEEYAFEELIDLEDSEESLESVYESAWDFEETECFIEEEEELETEAVSLLLEGEIQNPLIEVDSSMAAGQKVTYSCVWFGRYPQAEVVPEGAYTAIGGSYLQNGDVIKNDNLYAKLQEASWDEQDETTIAGKKYRRMKKEDALFAVDAGESLYAWKSDDTSYHYFRYAPIKWRVLSTDGNSALLLADKGLDDQKFDESNVYNSRWDQSQMRSFLNGYGSSENTAGKDYAGRSFYGSAFNDAERLAIRADAVSSEHIMYPSTNGGETTYDKIFLLSDKEVYGSEAQSYGYVASSDVYDEARQSKTSTYAKARGAWWSTAANYEGNCMWWLRSPGPGAPFVEDVNHRGDLKSVYNSMVTYDRDAVRPALRINLSSRTYRYAGTVCTDGTMDEVKYQEYTGMCGDNAIYVFDEETGILTISGTGDIYDFSVEQPAPWQDFLEGILEVVIEEGITRVGEYTFNECTSLDKITLPKGMLSIGQAAFRMCILLPQIDIPESVERVGRKPFQGCSKLEDITFFGYPSQMDPEVFLGLPSAAVYYPFSHENAWVPNVVDQNRFGNVNFVPWDDTFDRVYGGTVKVQYTSTVNNSYGEEEEINKMHQFYYTDSLFDSSSEYCNDLAVMTLGLEMAARTNVDTESYTYHRSDNRRASNLNGLYKSLGFKNPKFYNYKTALSDSSDKVAYSFATRKINSGKDKDTLVVIAIRGIGYGAEWASNFHIGTEGDHVGFRTPAQEIMVSLRQYISEMEDREGDLKFWITGFSRGAAVANIFAHNLNWCGISSPGNIFAYLFATPSGFRSTEASNDNNIFNIVSANDFVPKVALKKWGFRKYGVTKTLPEYSVKEIKAYFNTLSEGAELNLAKVNHLENAFFDELSKLVHNTDDYAKSEAEVISAWADEFSSKDGSVVKALAEMLRIIQADQPFRNATCTVTQSLMLPMTLGDIIAQLLFGTDARGLMYAHYPDYYLAWLEYGHSDYGTNRSARIKVANELDKIYKKTYKKYAIHCPVDVEVYNEAGNLVGCIKNNEVMVDQIPCYVDGDSKHFYLIGEQEYSITMKGTDVGTMNCTITEYQNGEESVEIVREVAMYDLPLDPNAEYKTIVAGNTLNAAENYAVTDARTGEILLPEMDTLLKPEEYSLTIEDDQASQVKKVVEGATVGITTSAPSGSVFEGWEIVSGDIELDNPTAVTTTLRMPNSDVVVRAKWRVVEQPKPQPHVHTYGSWMTTRQATALVAGTAKRKCSGCGNEETKALPKLISNPKLNMTTIPLKKGQSTTALKVSGLAKGDQVKSYQVKDTKIATVSAAGKIKAKKKGNTTLTVTLASGKSVKATIKVQTGAVKTTKLSVNTKKVTLAKGKSFSIVATKTPLTSLEKISYSSSKKSVATVSSKGVIKAKKKGTCKITVKAGKKKQVITVSVK